ncbi:hypothetical protein Q7P35_006504 [Cladosporium inversicolor]
MASRDLIGTFESVSNDNYEDYLQELGIAFKYRQIADVQSPTIKISTSETNKYRIETVAGFQKFQADFELGKPFEQLLLDGKKDQSLVVAEGGDLVEKQIIDGTHSDRRWHVDGTELKLTYNACGVTAVRTFERR